MAKKSEKEHAAAAMSTPGLATKEAESATHDGTVISVTGDKLVMTNMEGLEHSHALTADAKLTLDGETCTVADLKPRTKIRVTLHATRRSASRRSTRIRSSRASEEVSQSGTAFAAKTPGASL